MTQSINRIRFTKKALSALKTSVKPMLYYDVSCPGLGVRVSPRGKQSFFFQNGPKRSTLKTTDLETARKHVRSKQSLEEVHSDAAEWTLGHLFELWMSTQARPKKRTWKRDESRWNQYLKHWANRKLTDIRRVEVVNLHNKINCDVGPYAANDTLAFVSSLYSYAERFEYDGRNPARRIDRFPEQERERYLLAEEFPRWHEAVMKLTVSEARDFFLLALWTGIRRECVLAMRWDQIDLQSGVWRIPNEGDKGKRDLIIYLSDAALTVLKRRREHAQSDWVLPSRNGSKSGHYADPKAAWRRVLDMSGIKDLRVHDLRRTLGSWMAEDGVNLHIIGKVLGHKSQQATRIYARLGSAAVRDAVNSATSAMKATLGDNA